MNQKHKILMIDDDPFLLDMYGIKFEERDFEVITLPDYSGDFVQKVIDINPDIISLDVIVPGMDGFEAIKLLKNDDRTKNIPCVFLTNLGQQDDINKGMALGASGYIVMASAAPVVVIDKFIDILKSTNKELGIPTKD